MKKMLLLIVFALLFFTACQEEPEVYEPEPEELVIEIPPEPEPEPEPEEEEEEEDPGPDLTGLARNPLTGVFIDEDDAIRRPTAVVIDNIAAALPQSGLSQADMIYETLAEGATTRLVAVFTTMDAERIGPIRSTRHNYVDFALAHDAILVHHGGSPQGYTAISNLRADNIDGMHASVAFFRDRTRESGGTRPLEHSSFANASGLFEVKEERGFRQEIDEAFMNMFEFFEEDDEIEGEEVHEVVAEFAPGKVGRFHFIEGENVYLRTQNGNPHIDENTGQQLAVENVIIKYASMRVMDGVGRRDVTLIGEGRGTLHTMGVAIPVLWSRESVNAPTIWTFEDGEPMRLTPGKTWICLMPA